jgi:hypothetical protein
MPLIYSLVARGVAILAEYTSYHGNFNALAEDCLQKMKATERFSLVCDKHTFNFLRVEDFIFLVVADEAFGRQIPYAFLDRVSEEFMAKHAKQGKTAGAHSLDRVFGPKLKQHMVCLAGQQACRNLRTSSELANCSEYGVNSLSAINWCRNTA